MSTTYKVTVNVRCRKEHTCVSCGAVYSYEFVRRVTGSASSSVAASARANKLADKALEREVDLHPCPTCGLYQPDMVGQQRAGRHRGLFWLSLVAFATIVVLRMTYVFPADVAIWAAIAGCGLVALGHLAIDLRGPNRDTAANLSEAASRVAAGKLRHTPGALVAGIQADQHVRPAMPIGQKLALLVALATIALATAPELLRVTRGWPLNHDCYPPVVGPGDSARVYMDERIHSVKGYWRGRPEVTIQDTLAGPTADKVRILAVANQNDWGSVIEVKGSEKSSASRPWVSFTLPDDHALAGKTLTCDIAMDVEYPEVRGDSSFMTEEISLGRSITVRAAPAGAGVLYATWWWQGTVAGMGLLLFASVALQRSARAWQRRAKPVRLLNADGSARA